MLGLVVRLLFEVVELGITPAYTTVVADNVFVEPNSTTKWDKEWIRAWDTFRFGGFADVLPKAKEVAKGHNP